MILLMRHGESTWNAAGRMQGQDPTPPLTERGRQQVTATAEALEGRVLGILTSPARRARESADLLSAHLGPLPVYEDPMLVEKGLQESWESLEERIRTVITPDLPLGTLLVTHGDVLAHAVHLLAGVSVPVPANASVIGLEHADEGPWRAYDVR